jgi:hypothetical protein
VRPACTAFLTYVHLGADVRPRPAPLFTPATAGERQRWEAALARREARVLRVKRLRTAIQEHGGESRNVPVGPGCGGPGELGDRG